MSSENPLEDLEIPHKKGKFSDAEIKFIGANYHAMTDKELAKQLNRHIKSIYLQRRKHGFTKSDNEGKRVTQEKLEEMKAEQEAHPGNTKSAANLTVEERKDLFRSHFDTSGRGKLVRDICTKHEFNYYKDKWCDYLESLDTITTAEEETLHQIIMEEIQGWRIEKALKSHISKNEEDMAEGKRPEPISINYTEQLNKSRERHMKLQKTLNLSREQRLKQKGEMKINFVTICQELMKKEVRDAVGREAAILQFMQGKEESRLRSGNFLVGGNE